MKRIALFVLSVMSAVWGTASAQIQPANGAAGKASVVPNIVRFSGIAKDVNGAPLSDMVGVTFALYRNQQGGAPLWLETQSVSPDKNGHYSVSLGATQTQGLPLDLFSSGQAQWLGVQIEGQAEQPRVFLLSVPYALKAADAETIGGLPPSAFVLASPPAAGNPPIIYGASATNGGSGTNASTPTLAAASTTGSGTINFLPRWTSASNLGNSVLFQSGAGSTAKIGINTTTPVATLDVKGTTNLQGLLTSAPTGLATTSAGKTSQAYNFVASAFNSGTGKAVNQTFQWKAEPTGNNTASPAGTLNLLFGSGTSAAAETGLKINSKGVLSFATGQTFPGTGTITGVTAGMGLTGGGTSGKVTVNLDTSKIPQLSDANAFTSAQSITNNSVADALTVTNNAGSGYGIVTTGNGGGVFAEANNVGATGVFGANVASSGNGIGVQGFSVGGTGVYGSTSGTSGLFNGAAAVVGDSKNYWGVWGLSANADGVHGINGSGGAGVGAESKGQGYGVWAISSNANTYGVGVRGESFGNGRFPDGNGSDGVDGFAHSENGSGVAGINYTGGPGVYGHSSGGAGFTTDSYVIQTRNMGGWVKAMAFVDPFAPGGIAITRCFNSQASGSTVTTPPCGITIVHVGEGNNLLDFGFEVDDRFAQVTAQASDAAVNRANNEAKCFACFTAFVYRFDGMPVNQLQVISRDSSNQNGDQNALDVPFLIFVF